jgi:hypothetical protein
LKAWQLIYFNLITKEVQLALILTHHASLTEIVSNMGNYCILQQGTADERALNSAMKMAELYCRPNKNGTVVSRDILEDQLPLILFPSDNYGLLSWEVGKKIRNAH